VLRGGRDVFRGGAKKQVICKRDRWGGLGDGYGGKKATRTGRVG